MKFYNPSAEERAFLFQEAQELEPLMKDLGSLSVMVEERTGRKNQSRFRVTFVVAPESVAMRVRAEDGNLFEATMAAKAEAKRQLNAIVNSMPQEPSKIPPEFLH